MTRPAVDPRGYVKKLALPDGFAAPRTLEYEDVRAIALSRVDLEDDVAGINSSIELIQRTRGGGWPDGPVERDYNFVDLVWHEQEFRELTSFSYVVRDDADRYLGCCYLYPMGQRTELTEELISHDVDVSWWVVPEAYEQGYYEKLHAGLQRWVVGEFPFLAPFYSNREVPA